LFEYARGREKRVEGTRKRKGIWVREREVSNPWFLHKKRVRALG
jgi:hypothetical protein